MLNFYQYSAFGETIISEETTPNRLRYNAQTEDELTGLYYLRARYYAPNIGRFTQEDVIYHDGLNLYAYCDSNPVMYCDPSGFAKTSACEPKVGGESSAESGKGISPMTWNEFQEANKGKYTNSEMSDAWNKYKQVNYPNGGEHYLNRPYIRQEILDEINANTRINSKGQIWDPISRKWVNPNNVELGHVKGHEYCYERDMAESKGWTQSQFNEYMNNSSFYAWQDIHDNRSHKYEDKH